MNDLQPLVPGAPRYAASAPLPRTRFVPGLHPHPRRDPDGSLFGQPDRAPGLPADRWRDDASYLIGIDLYHQGFLWESHEAFEACWFTAGSPLHRDLLQSLIQIAAAELQLHRRVPGGVRILAGRLSQRLGGVVSAMDDGRRLCGLDMAEVHLASLRRFRGALERGGDPLQTGGPPVELRIEEGGGSRNGAAAPASMHRGGLT